jgi:hypothetical protein
MDDWSKTSDRSRGANAMELPADIFTEPDDVDPETLANLGPLRRLAGIWEGQRGVDINPKADGPETREYYERIEMQPIDPQANGPQLFYGLRYYLHVNTREEDISFHDQVGYWLYEAATGLILQTLAIPPRPDRHRGGPCRARCQAADGQGGARPKRIWHLLDELPRPRFPHRQL